MQNSKIELSKKDEIQKQEIYAYESTKKITVIPLKKTIFPDSTTISYINSLDEIIIKLQGVDESIYASNTLTASSIVIKVGGTAVTPSKKELSSSTNVTGGVQYLLTLSGITGNGDLTIEVAANTLKDSADNQNIKNVLTTGIKVDNTVPTVTFGTNGNTTYKKSQSTTVTVADSLSGVNTSTLKYQWTQSTTAPLENTFSTTFINGQAVTKSDGTGNNWYLWILAKDNSGNSTIIKSNAFYLDNTVPTVTFGTNGNPTNAKICSTTINVTDTSSLTTLRGRWMQGTTALTQLSDFTGAGGWAFTNGSVSQQNPGATGDWYLWVYAEDSAGNYKIAHTNVFKIDTTGPTFTSVEIKNLSTTGYDVYVYGVTDAGAGIDRVQFPTWTEANGQDDLQTNWETSVAAKGVKQVDGTTWVYRVNVTAHKNEYGLYNTHIYMYDILGNVSNATIQTPTVPAVKVTYDNNYLSENLWTDIDDLGRYFYYSTVTSSKTNTKDTSVMNGYITELTMNAGSVGGSYYMPSTSLITAGNTYTWSVYIKASSNKTLNIGQEQGGVKQINATTSWQKITHTFTASSSGSKAFIFYIGAGSWTAGDKIYVHSLEIKQGNYTDSSIVDKGYASQLGTLGSPTRTGYTFTGWFTAPTGGTQISNATTTPASNTSYYAHWTINSYTVYYNGGTVQTQTKMYNEKLGTLPTVSYAGYTFDGWFTQMSGGTKVTSEMRVTNNVSYYAMSSKTVTATRRWWANGTEYYYGTAYIDYTGTQINAQIDIGGSYTPSGWTFRGYSTDSAGNAGINISGNVVSTSSDITVYASYSKTVTVTKRWWLNGTKTYTGTAYLDFEGNIINAAINVGVPFIPEGWTFRGYSTSDAGNAGINISGTTVYALSNTTVYASYQKTVTAYFKRNNETTENYATATGIVCMNYAGTNIAATIKTPAGIPEAWGKKVNGAVKYTVPFIGWYNPGRELAGTEYLSEVLGYSPNVSMDRVAIYNIYKHANGYIGANANVTSTTDVYLYAQYYNEKQRFVDYMYNKAFNRCPDMGGNMDHLINSLSNSNKSEGMNSVMKGFVNSPEAKDKYGDSNDGFIRRAYICILGREPDSSGLSAYRTYLNNGGSRDDMLNTLCNSQECTNLKNTFSW